MDEKTDSEVVRWYNLRGETSENRLKELRSDFGAARLPCGDFGANAAWLQMTVLAYNLHALMRVMLPLRWMSCCTPTVRLRLYAVAGQIVRHPEQGTLKVCARGFDCSRRCKRFEVIRFASEFRRFSGRQPHSA